jgi:hypothetical protein
MNTGLQDAHNLACKLADVIAGRSGPGSLERYETERRPVARRLVQSTDAIFARITSGTRLARFARDRVVPFLAPLAVRLVPRLVGTERMCGYLAQLRIHYWMSAEQRIRRRGRRDRVVGRRLAWSGSNFGALRTMTWQVHGCSTWCARTVSSRRPRSPPKLSSGFAGTCGQRRSRIRALLAVSPRERRSNQIATVMRMKPAAPAAT